jgi:hypothetical protein
MKSAVSKGGMCGACWGMVLRLRMRLLWKMAIQEAAVEHWESLEP